MALPRATGLPASVVHAPGMPGASPGRPAVNKQRGLGQELLEAELFTAELGVGPSGACAWNVPLWVRLHFTQGVSAVNPATLGC